MPKLVFFRNIDVSMQSEFFVIWTSKKANLLFSSFSFLFITFDNVRSSFTKRQDMFPAILALCFVL